MISRQSSFNKKKKYYIPPPTISGSGLVQNLERRQNAAISNQINNILDNLKEPEYPIVSIEEEPAELELDSSLAPAGHAGAGMKKQSLKKLLPPGGNPAKDLIQRLLKSHR